MCWSEDRVSNNSNGRGNGDYTLLSEIAYKTRQYVSALHLIQELFDR